MSFSGVQESIYLPSIKNIIHYFNSYLSIPIRLPCARQIDTNPASNNTCISVIVFGIFKFSESFHFNQINYRLEYQKAYINNISYNQIQMEMDYSFTHPQLDIYIKFNATVQLQINIAIASMLSKKKLVSTQRERNNKKNVNFLLSIIYYFSTDIFAY